MHHQMRRISTHLRKCPFPGLIFEIFNNWYDDKYILEFVNIKPLHKSNSLKQELKQFNIKTRVKVNYLEAIVAI